jgi:hypothetical protein
MGIGGAMYRNCPACKVLLLVLVLFAPLSLPDAVFAVARSTGASPTADAIELSVECRANPTAEPRVCYLSEPIYAVLKSSTEVDYVVCQPEPPPQPERCTEPLHANAGVPSAVPAGAQLGVHSLSWKYAATGAEIGSVQYSVEKPPGILFAQGASDQFTARIHRQFAGAFFPKRQRRQEACRKVYVRSSGRIAVCFIEYVKAGRWHLLRGVENIPPALNEIVLKIVSDQSWQRKTRRCLLPPRVPGVLTSNNGCGRAMPYSDSQLITTQLLANIRAGRPLERIRWKPLLGPASLATFRGHRAGNALRFDNEVGDWFAYVP